MEKRYKVVPERTEKGIPIYVVVDTATGKWEHVRQIQRWAESIAEKLNREYENRHD